jgi:hypothetical protein
MTSDTRTATADQRHFARKRHGFSGRAGGGPLAAVVAGFFAVVVVVAAGSAVVLLGWPGSTGTYFSWKLGPPPAAALVGGLYLGSTVAFGWALSRKRHEVWVLSVGVLGIALPTLLFTAVHDEVFDWGRWQAVAWVVLFCAAPLSIAADLAAPTQATPGEWAATRAPTSARAIAGVVAALAGVGAGVIFGDASRAWLSGRSPIALIALTGRYLGAWCCFVLVAGLAAAWRGRRCDLQTLAVILGVVAGGAAVGAARTWGAMGPGRLVYIAGLVALAGLAGGIWTLSSVRPPTSRRRRAAGARMRPGRGASRGGPRHRAHRRRRS